MKIAILGAGALGSVIGGLLAASGRDVALWDLNQPHINAIRSDGLKIDGPDGTQVVRIPAMLPCEAETTPDLIVLLTKTIHSEAALRGIQRHIDAGARVLTLQNGLGNATKIARVVPPDRVLYGCTMMPGRFISPGHVASQGKGYAVFKAYTDAGRGFAEGAAISSPGVTLQFTDETDRIIWQKAAFNCAMNACTALTGARVGQLTDASTIEVLHEVSAEVIEVAQKRGVPAHHSEVVAQIAHALQHHTEHKPSMLQDLEAARPTEIDSLCAEVARQAQDAGIDAPRNRLLARLIELKSKIAAETST